LREELVLAHEVVLVGGGSGNEGGDGDEFHLKKFC
jgi:hypothetical protein